MVCPLKDVHIVGSFLIIFFSIILSKECDGLFTQQHSSRLFSRLDFMCIRRINPFALRKPKLCTILAFLSATGLTNP